MTSFKSINFNQFPVKVGDTVMIKTTGAEDFSFEVKKVVGFSLIPTNPVTLSDGTGPYTLIPIVDHGFQLKEINGKRFSYSSFD